MLDGHVAGFKGDDATYEAALDAAMRGDKPATRSSAPMDEDRVHHSPLQPRRGSRFLSHEEHNASLEHKAAELKERLCAAHMAIKTHQKEETRYVRQLKHAQKEGEKERARQAAKYERALAQMKTASSKIEGRLLKVDLQLAKEKDKRIAAEAAQKGAESETKRAKTAAAQAQRHVTATKALLEKAEERVTARPDSRPHPRAWHG